MPSLSSLLTLAAIGASTVVAGSGFDVHHDQLLHRRSHVNKRSSNDRMVKSYKRGTLSKRGQTYTTQAQYYATTGGYSACHTYFDDNSMVFSLPTGLWPDVYTPSPLCGKQVIATNPATGKSLTLTVQDASWFAGSVQLPKGVYTQLGGSLEQGVLPIEFHFVDTDLNLPQSTSGATDIFGASSSDIRAQATSAASVAAVKQNNVVVPQQTTTTTAAATTTEAPRTTEAPKTTEAATTTTTVDQASIESVKLAAEQANSASSAAAAAASASAAAQAEQQAEDEAEQKAKEEADKKAAEEAAAAAAAASSSSAAAAAAAAATTTTTTEAPEPTSDGGSNGNTGGDVISGGYATYFLQAGNPGNCGTVAQDSEKVIALPTQVYADGQYCGRQIKITRVSDGATVVATVRCVNNESLDLSVGAFTAIATEAEGMVPITWQWA
ncbi:hypothetical protein OIO90_003205 [Microbotryomycetes sp. JL221]|nr:hypothetical protein OIO90_003205 [Microbotryomycetes sp. JL221]